MPAARAMSWRASSRASDVLFAVEAACARHDRAQIGLRVPFGGLELRDQRRDPVSRARSQRVAPVAERAAVRQRGERGRPPTWLALVSGIRACRLLELGLADLRFGLVSRAYAGLVG